MNKLVVARAPQSRPVPVSRWLVSAAVAAAISGTAFAPPGFAADEDSLAEVTVTGSRIMRRDLEASSPIVTVDAQLFQDQSGISVESALNQLPQFKSDRTQFVAGDVQATAFNTPGISSLNLRGLGANRNLVLVDGRRAQPANATLTVDVNSIPTAALDSVEVISGGASAVYGADAIAGVVNFKLKHDFEGLALDAQTSITEQGDGAETRVSALIGGNFGDGRGNVMVGLELARRSAVMQRDRDFYVNGWDDVYTTGGGLTTLASWNPAAGAPSQAAVNSVFGTTGTTISRTTNFYVNTNGTIFKQNPAARYQGNVPGIKTVLTAVSGTTPGSIVPRSVLAEPERNGQASSPLDRYSIFARGSFKINDNITAFVQANMSEFEVDQILTYAPATSFWAANIPRDATHPIPTELATLLDSRTTNPATATWQFERILDYMGPRRSHNESTVYQVLAGLSGNLGLGDWTWELYGSHGETKTLNYLNGGFVSSARYNKVITAPNYGRGFSMTDPSGILGYKLTCTSGLPVFSSFTPSQDCMDAIEAKMKNITSFSQDIIEANFQGGLFDLPAGQLRGAAGLSYRKNAVNFEPDILNNRESTLDFPIGLFAANGASGDLDAKEVYGELLVPVLSGIPGISELSLELGGRYSDYSTEGGLFTYKILANWRINEFVSFRGGYQEANRAPNTAELYAGVTTFVAGFPYSDPCAINTRAPWGNLASNANRAQVQALCSAIIGSGTSVFDSAPSAYIGGNGGFFPLELELRQGNLDLESEKAKTITAGIVLRSPFQHPAANGMSLTLDWYDITVDNAISPLPSTTVYENCFNASGTSNPTYSLNDPGGFCGLIVRDPVTGGRATVQAPYFNLGTIKTSGIDVQYTWRAGFDDMGLSSVPGSMIVNLSGTYLLEYQTQNVPGGVFYENKGSMAQNGQYDYRWNLGVNYLVGDWNVGLGWQYLPSAENAVYPVTPTTTLQGPGSYSLFNLSANWTVNDTVALRFGVDNLFDVAPQVVGRDPGFNEANGSTAPNAYDVLGRRYYAGVKLSF